MVGLCTCLKRYTQREAGQKPCTGGHPALEWGGANLNPRPGQGRSVRRLGSHPLGVVEDEAGAVMISLNRSYCNAAGYSPSCGEAADDKPVQTTHTFQP
jgi:hypothetical protein